MSNVCCAEVGDTWFRHACGKNAKFERDGKHYCGTHDPVAIRARRDKKNAQYDAEYNQRREVEKAKAAALAEQKRRADCFDDLLAALQLSVEAMDGSNDSSLFGRAYKAAHLAIFKATGVKP